MHVPVPPFVDDTLADFLGVNCFVVRALCDLSSYFYNSLVIEKSCCDSSGSFCQGRVLVSILIA